MDPWSALKDDFLLSEPPGKPLELVWGVELVGGGGGAEIFIGKKKIKGCEWREMIVEENGRVQGNTLYTEEMGHLGI